MICGPMKSANFPPTLTRNTEHHPMSQANSESTSRRAILKASFAIAASAAAVPALADVLIYLFQSSKPSRWAAGAFGLFIFSQSHDRPMPLS
jgi:hypothetical protein